MLNSINFAVITYDANWVISLVIALVVTAIGDLLMFKYVSRHPIFIGSVLLLEAGVVVAFCVPNFDLLGIICAIAVLLLVSGAVLINMNNVRNNMVNGIFKKDFFRKNKVEPEMVFDRDDLIVNAGVKRVRNESCADTLDLMRSRCSF